MSIFYKVSICVPIYGVERYIERCAISLFEQTYGNIEYIFVNDCTKDRSITILEKVIDRYPNRKDNVKIINHETNKRLGEARNTAVSAVTGEFLMHVDSDDYIDRNVVELCVLKQIEANADIVNFDAIKYNKNSQISLDTPDYNCITDNLFDILKRKIAVSVWGKMIRTSLYQDNDIKVEGGINCSEDYMVTSRLYYYAKKVAKVEDVYYYYDCCNELSLTNSFSIDKVKDDCKALDFLKEFFSDKKEYCSAFQEGALSMYIQILRECALYHHKKCFDKVKSSIKSLDCGILNRISFADKLLLNMDVKLAHKYIKWGLALKSFFRKYSKQ